MTNSISVATVGCKLSLLLTLSCLACLVGCGPGYKIVNASGRITLDGKPLANATIITQPVGTKENVTPGPGSGGKTDEDGNFVLTFQDEERKGGGAVPGPAMIKITEDPKQRASNDDSAEIVRSGVPLDYQEMKIEYTIPEDGTDAMDFQLKSERRRRK